MIKSKTYLYLISMALCLCSIIFIGCQKAGTGKIIAKVNSDVITEAEFVKVLPGGYISDSIEQSQRHALLDDMITKLLFAQDAKRLGLDKDVDLMLERDQKTILIQALYDDVVTKNVKISKKEIDTAKKLLMTEVHVKVIVVPDENTAKMVSDELKKGAVFDSVAKMYSQDQSGQQGGDVGFIPMFYLDELSRKAVEKMKPGEISEPIKGKEDYKIINFIEKRTNPSTKDIQDNTRKMVEQQKSQELATAYLTKMDKRLVYNPEGLCVFYKPVDSITTADGEIWVVKKDTKKVVYAKNLLHVAKEFPASLDTLMRSYSIKRAVEEDVLYEDALERKLDKKPEILSALNKRRADLLYEKYYLNEITQKTTVSDTEIMDYFKAHKDEYAKSKLSEVEPMIRNQIFSNKRQAMFQTIVNNLKSQAKIDINEKLLMSAGKSKVKKNVKTGGK